MQHSYSSTTTATLLFLIAVPTTWTLSGCSSTRVADANNGTPSAAAYDASAPTNSVLDAGQVAPSATSPCAQIDAECRSYDDQDGLGRLCLEAAAGKDTAQCQALAEECAAWCRPNGSMPPPNGTTLSLELCDETLGDRCHPLDNGAGLAHLCHEVGHAGNLEWCAALYDECAALCGAEETEHDAGPDAAESDAASTAPESPDAEAP